jgi:hypothetical protein
MTTRTTAACLAIAATACSSSHTIAVPTSLPEPKSVCTIGVGRFVDDTGLDLGVDLRDYLRAHGPCRTVVLVSSDDDDRPDVIVRGSARAQMTRDIVPAGMWVGSAGTGAGLGLLLVAGIFVGVAGATNCSNTTNPGECRSTNDTLKSMGGVSAYVGAGLAAVGVTTMVLDYASFREMKLTGTVEADVDIERDGGSIARWTSKDEVVSRGSHPSGRPESRDSLEAAGPLYPEFFAGIFGDIASRLDDTVRHLPPRAPR